MRNNSLIILCTGAAVASCQPDSPTAPVRAYNTSSSQRAAASPLPTSAPGGETLLAADAVVFQPTFEGNTPRAIDGAGLNGCYPNAIPPGGVAHTGDRVWVADVCNRRVLGFSVSALSGASAEVVLLQRDFYDRTHQGFPASDHIEPVALASDTQGRLYVGGGEGRVFVYESPIESGKRHDYELAATTPHLRDVESVFLGPTQSEFIAVVTAEQVVFYPTGSTNPVEAFSFELNPCPFALTGIAQIADTLLLSCENLSHRCGAIDQGGLEPPSYNHPSYGCSAVYAARIDTSINETEYRFPRLDPVYGTHIIPAFATPYAVRGMVASTALNAVWISDAGHRAYRLTGALNHLDALFNQGPGASTHPYEARSPSDAATPIYGQDNTTNAYPNRDDKGVGNVAKDNSLHSPGDLLVDSLGDLWLLDVGNNRLLQYVNAINGSTAAVTVLGQATFAARLPNRLEAYSAQAVTDVAVAPGDRFFVADEASHRVLSFPKVGNLGAQAAADRVYGQVFYDTALPNNLSGGSLQANDLQRPSWVAVDPSNGDIYVSDFGNNRILIYSGDSTTPSAIIGAPNYTTPGNSCFVFKDLAVRGSTLYVSVASRSNGTNPNCVDEPQANRIFAYNLPYVPANPAAALPDRVFGQDLMANLEDTPNLPNRGSTFARADTLNDVAGLWVDDNNRLWVADRGNHRVLWFNDPKGSDYIAATTADGVVGQLNMFQSDEYGPYGVPSAWTFSGPQDVVVDSNGGLWVSLPSNHRVLYFPEPMVPSPDLPQASIVLGQSDFSSGSPNNANLCPSPCGTNPRGLNTPTALALDVSGRQLLVADTGNMRLLRFTRNQAPVITGSGTFEVEAGQTRDVPLTVTDPDQDDLANAVLVSVVPVSAQGDVVLQGSQVSYTAPAGSEGTRVSVRVDIADKAPRPLTASATVVFQVVPAGALDEANWTPRPQPDPATPKSPAQGCLCTGADPSGWLLLAACLWLLRRRRGTTGERTSP